MSWGCCGTRALFGMTSTVLRGRMDGGAESLVRGSALRRLDGSLVQTKPIELAARCHRSLDLGGQTHGVGRDELVVATH
eukprot:14717173-Heterocapsa_arctica.AAC.1